jgi:hypothetical protein
MTRFEWALELMKADAKSADKRMKRIWSKGSTVREKLVIVNNRWKRVPCDPNLEVPKPHPGAPNPAPYMPATCALYAPVDKAYNPGMRFADNYMGADF